MPMMLYFGGPILSNTILRGFILSTAVALAVTTGSAGLRAQDAPDQGGVKSPIHHMDAPGTGAGGGAMHKKKHMKGKMAGSTKAPVHHMEPQAQ
jgi:hypothetical protein